MTEEGITTQALAILTSYTSTMRVDKRHCPSCGHHVDTRDMEMHAKECELLREDVQS